MDQKKYDWAAYYMQACEREKKKTESLMVKLYAEEKNRDVLQEKYNKITGGVAWKCLDCFRVIRNAFGRLKGSGKKTGADGQGTEEMPARVSDAGYDAMYSKQYPEDYGKFIAAYQEELSRQMDPYSEWYFKKEQSMKAQALETCGISAEEAGRQCQIVPYQEIEVILKGLVDGREKEDLPELFLFAEDPHCLSADAPRLALAALREHPEAVFWYGDEDFGTDSEGGAGDERGHQCPYFKPDWSPDTLAGFFYFGSYVGIRPRALVTENVDGTVREMVKEELYKGGCTPREILYGLCLSLTWHALFSQDKETAAGYACHTPFILYTSPRIPAKRPKVEGVFENTNSEDYRLCDNYWGYEPQYARMKKEWLERVTSCDYIIGTTALEGVGNQYPVCSPKDMPTVSVVIPSKDHVSILQSCISSFLERTDYPEKKVEFIVVDNGSAEENRRQVEACLEGIKEQPMVSRTVYLYEKANFNFSKMCNAGAKAAEGELILLLNDDIEILVQDWLKIMVGQTFIPGTGAVGAKLWYPDCEKIQHAGITNLSIGPSHKLITFPEDRLYYYGHGAVSMDMMAVTAACLLVKKAVYDGVGGLYEELAVAYNDVEFCFRLLKNGYRNVQRNDAVLCHHESLSRGRDDASDEKWDRLYAERRKLYDLYPQYEGYDPYYSPYLIQDLAEYITGASDPFVERLNTTECVRTAQWEELQPLCSDWMQLTIDRVLLQRKFHMEEPDILMAEGWCYLPGADNALYEAFLTLRSPKGMVFFYPVKAKYRYDVCAILSHEKNIGLAGFTCRVLKEGLEKGSYQAGLLYRHRGTGQEIWKESELTVEVQ